MALNFKKSLLAGTALVAVSFAHMGAANAQINIGGIGDVGASHTWGLGNNGATVGISDNASILIDDNGASIGAITSSNNGKVLVINYSGKAGIVASTIDSITKGDQSFTVNFGGSDLAEDHVITVTNGIDAGTGSIALTSPTKSLDMHVAGNITANAFSLNGATTRLNLNGAGSQTINAVISGGGNVTIDNGNFGVTFSKNATINELLLASATAAADFNGDTTTITAALNIGAGQLVAASGATFTASNGINLSTPTSVFNVDGAVAQTINANIVGSNANGIVNIQNTTAQVNIAGTMNVDTLTLSNGADLKITSTGASTVDTAIALGTNATKLTLSGTGTFTATNGITGTGAISLDGGATLAGGNVAANTLAATSGSNTVSSKVTIAGATSVSDGATLTLSGAGGSSLASVALNATGTIAFNHDTGGGNDVTVSGAVTGGTVKNGAGDVDFTHVGGFGATNLEYTGTGQVTLSGLNTATAANVNFGANNGRLVFGNNATGISGNITMTGENGQITTNGDFAFGGTIGDGVVNYLNTLTLGGNTTFNKVVYLGALNAGNHNLTFKASANTSGTFQTGGNVTLEQGTEGDIQLFSGGGINIAIGGTLTNTSGTNTLASKAVVTGLTTVTADSLTNLANNTALNGGADVKAGALLAFTHGGGAASIGGASLTGDGTLENGTGTLNISSDAVNIANIEYTGAGIINISPTKGPMVFDSAVNFKGNNGVLNLNANVGTVNKAIVTATTENTGEVATTSATTFNQTVGGVGMALNKVTLNGNAVFENELHTQTLSAAANVTFKSAANIANAWGANDVTLETATVGTVAAPGGDVAIGGKLISTGASTVHSNVMVMGDTEVNGASLTLLGAGSTLAGVTLGGNTLNFSGASFGAIAGGGTFKLQGTGDVTANGATHVANIVFDTDRALNLNGSEITGNITSTADNGTVGSMTGFSKITGNIASHLKAITLDRNAEVAGTMRAATTTSIGGHTLNITGGTASFTTGATDTLYFEATNKTTHGKITVNGEANIHADTTVKIKVIGGDGANLSHGDKLTLVDGTVDGKVATLNAEKLNTDNSTVLLSFTQDTSTTQDLRVMVNRKSSGGSSTGENNQNVGGAMDSMAPVITDPDLKSFEARLLSAKTVEELNALLESVAPDMSGGSVAATVAVGNQTSTIVNNRVNTVRTGDNTGSGIATGNSWQDRFMWAQAFGAKADQGKRGGIAGYDADTYGFVVGMDGEVSDQSRLGIALSYANTDVKAQDVNRSSSDVDSYQISLYGDYDLGSDYFLNGQIAYIYSDVDTKRYDVGGVFGNTASGSFHNNQYSARAEIGKAFDAGHNVSLTPSLLANYNYVDVGSYTEKGAGGLGLRNVSTDHLQILEFGANLIAEANFDDGHGGIFTPSVHGGYRYDVIGDRVATTASFAGGGAAFGVKGADPAQGTFNVGAGLKWDMSSSVNLSAQYDYQTKSDYDEHSGYIRAGYRF